MEKKKAQQGDVTKREPVELVKKHSRIQDGTLTFVFVSCINVRKVASWMYYRVTRVIRRLSERKQLISPELNVQ